MFQLIKRLYQINLLSLKGIYYLLGGFRIHGINLLGILHFSSKLKPDNKAVEDVRATLSYAELYSQANLLAKILTTRFSIDKTSKVALLCSNHSIGVSALCALSRLGSDVLLLNVEMSTQQIKQIAIQRNFDLIIYDSIFSNKIEDLPNQKIASYCSETDSLEELIKNDTRTSVKLRRQRSGNISVLTGGTSGTFKVAKRKPSLINLAMPFFALINKLKLENHHNVYIGVPMYHGYGLASISIALILQKEMQIRSKFKTTEALEIIERNQIELVITVPTILKRLLEKDQGEMQTVHKILSGGAALDAKLIEQTKERYGSILFNLYGTSESGFSVIATPKDLDQYPETIGKTIRGVQLKIRDSSNAKTPYNQLGTIHIKSSWSMKNVRHSYLSTGDMGHINKEGYLFLKGRNDDMIVSGGENVFPKDIEVQLLDHPEIKEAIVIGIEDEEFGKRLVAFTVMTKGSELNSETILSWLKSNVARYQMPSRLLIVPNIPYKETGKADKKKLIYRLKQIDLNNNYIR